MPPLDPCGTAQAAFTAGVSTFSATLGATAVYGWENWFTSLTLSGTASFGDNTDDEIRSFSGSARLGRRWVFGKGNIAAPYIGASYFDLDQVVTGVTRLNDAFPDGDSLEVRYEARTRNKDKWSGVLGLNLGLISGYSVTLETALSENSQRFILGANRRF